MGKFKKREYECQYCGATFKGRAPLCKPLKYCSHKCRVMGIMAKTPAEGYNRYKDRNTKYPIYGICIICNKFFKRKYPSNQRQTCSKECRSKYKTKLQKGDKSHRWEGGKTSKAMIIRNSKKYKNWRDTVFKRDNYTCQECGKIGGKLNADHIKPFSLYPELRLDLNNGRTLCEDCHKKTKTWGKMSTDAQKHMEKRGTQSLPLFQP